jgi:hypothetical protein
MSDLISRSALLGGYDVRKVTEYDESGCGLEYKAVPVEAIEAAPAVDAVEVVRCRDCKHYQPEPMGSVLYCYQNRRWTEPDFYCADGAKMDAEVEG